MNEYLKTLSDIAHKGYKKTNRTGTDTLSLHGIQNRYNLSEGFPLVTTRKVPYRSIFAELLWLLSGAPHIKDLQRAGFSFWNAWADEEGYLETSYARYWRYYPLAPMLPSEPILANEEYITKIGNLPAFDQLKAMVDELKENPNSRRLIVSAWYPPNAYGSKLPPCHHTWQVIERDGVLDLVLTQRSGDYPVGIVFNIACYSALLMLIAREVGMKAGEFIHNITDAHIYVDQLDGVREQLDREPAPLPKLELPNKSLFDLTMDDLDDFKIIDYITHPSINYPVAI